MKFKTHITMLLVSAALFSCCQKDSSLSSGTTDKDQSYILFQGERFSLTDGEFYAGELSLFDETPEHDYEIDVELWDESSVLAAGDYKLTATASDKGLSEAILELSRNASADSADTAQTDTLQALMGKHPLASASMKVSEAGNIYTIAISGLTAGGQEVRAHYVGRLYFADKKKRKH